jgi:Zn-dependent peptidase ImmA (M78 family)
MNYFDKRADIPAVINLGYHRITVTQVTRAAMRDLGGILKNGDTCEGLWDCDKETIYLLSNLAWRKKRYYLMHEMVHACLDLMDSLETGP